MTSKSFLFAALALIALIGMVPVMGKIGKKVGEIPLPTPLDVPSALRKIDTTYASQSSDLKTATPSGIRY
ncbi:MAG: hypothetical protein M3Q44_06190 [bacterium]|nr:hypothetical protein [bacterium]